MQLDTGAAELDTPPRMPDVDAEAELTLFSALVDIASVRRRYEFFLWTQTQLQILMPHSLLICGLPRAQSARMVFDHYYSVPFALESISRLCDARDGIANEMVDRWIGEGFEPLMIHSGASHGAEARMAAELASLGFGDTIVHGVPKAQATASAHGIFAFVSLTRTPDERERQIVQLLVPQLFGAYCRALTRDRPQAVPETSTPASSEPDAPITEREVEILRWIREGKSNQEIGMILSISPLTVKNHVQKILRKLNASNRAQAVSKAISLRLLTATPMRRQAGGSAQDGFTLLEVLVVLVIIGLLAGIVAPKFFAQVGKSEVRVAQAQLESLGKALDQYRLDTGRYPSSSQGLVALVAKPDDEARWQGPYIGKQVPADPWGRPYVYRAPGSQNAEFELVSYGKDGQPGGQGDAQDVMVER